MAKPGQSTTDPTTVAQLAAGVRTWLVGLLVVAYALAAVVPGPGVWLRDLGVADESANAPLVAVRFSLVMVGLLLLCGAASVDVAKLRELPQRPGGLGLALLGVWGPPLGVVGIWAVVGVGWLPTAEASALAIGLALAGAMPVANSAVAWTHQSGGSLVWALGLVVLSICVCPWVAPAMLRLMGLALAGDQAAEADLFVSRFTGAIFFLWVLGPTLLGFAVRFVLGGERLTRARPWLTLVSATALLLLNYANAAAALPSVFAEPRWALLATTLVAAISLPLAGALAGLILASWIGVSRRARTAWAYALGMKNTGLALGLAGATLGDQPVVVLVILAVTLTQHVVAGVVHLVLGVEPPSGDP